MSDRILSCFIDESGDFGPYDFRSPNYYVSMVLHDQSIDISEKIAGILSMITPGTHYLAIALTAIVIGQVFTILVLRDRNKEKQ